MTHPGSAKPHAFVVMPFGKKIGSDGTLIDFNSVYDQLIKHALERAGMSPFRADQEMRAGDIRPDMFQELLVADLVVADLTIDNPNVWYELGVRHALRARGVVLICGGHVSIAFDLYTDRKMRYSLNAGVPDPKHLEQEIVALAAMIKATMESWHGRKISPVYQLLPNLQEPDWTSLRVGDVREFWDQHEAWENRIELARCREKIGDLLVLANEGPVAAFRATAWFKAGEALRKAERFRLALEHLSLGLSIDPYNLTGLRETGICLQRLAMAGDPKYPLERARRHYRSMLRSFPQDAETWALLGRVDKDAWVQAWRQSNRTSAQRREDATHEDALLCATIDSYAQGYRKNPRHYYSGINALTLMHLFGHLKGDSRYDTEATMMAGAVRFAATHETVEQQQFWAKCTLGDLEVLVGTPQSVRKAYQEAIARNERDWFELHSCRAQLQLLQDLDFRPETVTAGIATFDRALQKLSAPQDWQPRQVLLFSGHVIDAPERSISRFPADKEPIAARSIADALEQFEAGDQDLALCQAAAGGDLLFLEACQERGLRCQILLPHAEAEFIDYAINPSARAGMWRERFFAMQRKLQQPIRFMPDELGPAPLGISAFERCNLWLLYTALAYGVEKVRFIALWNGSTGDGPGGTEHLYNEVRRRTGRVTWLDTRELW